ncbi:MAG: geranylgeranylglycerol-phosphate geranylgeranyltransferase [Bacteroidota bacterium]
MSFEKITASVQLLRPLNVAIMMLVTSATVIFAGGSGVPLLSIAIAGLVAGFIGGAANAINDYYDVAIDRVNRPNRPLPRGAVNPRVAIVLWITLSLVGISLNLFLNSSAFWIAVAAVVALFAYSARLKRTVLIGNIVVAAMTGMAFVYGAVVAEAPEKALFPFLFAFLINLGREILKDIEDMAGDQRDGAVTLPLKHGPPAALAIATVVFVALIAATIVPFTVGVYGSTYLIVVSVVNILLCYVMVSMWTSREAKNLGRLNSILKIGMVIGLVAMVFGVEIE